jgi:hypothetical protein
MITYIELDNVHIDYQVDDHPHVEFMGAWLSVEGKPDVEITDYLNVYSRDQCEQAAIKDYEQKCHDAAEHAEAMEEARADSIMGDRMEKKMEDARYLAQDIRSKL